MKNFYCIFLFLILLVNFGTAQDDCCTAFPLSGNGPVPISSSAGNGTFEDLSACSCLATDEHDSYWFSFECTSTGTFEMMITPENLSADFDFAVYSGGCPCSANTVVASCDYTGPINPPGPFVPTGIASDPMGTFGVPGATEFQPTITITQGTVYWIIADNITTNGAGFTIEFAGTAGMGSPPPNFPPPPAPLLGEMAPCPGGPFTYSVPDDPSLEFEWSVDPTGPSISGNGANVVDITWDGAGLYTLCVEGSNNCNTSIPTCVVVFVSEVMGPLQEDVICVNGVYEAPDGQTFFGPGLHEMVFTNYQGCDSIVPLLLDLALTAITITVEELCDGDCLEFAGETICQTGVYEEVLQTYQGCDSTVVLSLILIPNDAVIVGGGSISCNGDPVILDGSQSIGGSNMTFEWTNSSGTVLGSNPTLTVFQPGDYTLAITSEAGANICSDMETITVAAANIPPANITATGGTITCTETTVTLMGNSSTPNVTYTWTGPGGFNSPNQNPTVSSIGTYLLTVTGANGCTGTATAIVDGDSNIPTASAVGGTLTCSADSISIMGNSNTAGVTYAWTGPAGFTSPDQNPTISTTGTYNLVVTAPNGCSAQASAVVDEDLAAPDASAQGGEIDCANTTTTLMGNSMTPNVSYSWTGPNGFTSPDQNPSVNLGGTYTLTVIATNGCTSTATAEVDQYADLPDAIATGGMVNCEMPNLTLTGSSNTPGVTFSWAGPNGYTSNLQNPVVTDPGDYTLTVSSTNGCSASDLATVTQDIAAPDASATGGTVTCSTGSVTLMGSSTTPNVTYSWVGPAGNNYNGQNPTVSQIGTYILNVTAGNGCTSNTTADVLQDAGVPDVSATGGTLNCNVNTITISGNSNTAGVTYSWTGPGGFVSTQTSEEVAVSGEYILTVTAANNCTSQATAVVVLDNALPDFSVIGGTLSCDSTQITLSSTVNTAGAIIEWNGPGGYSSSQPNPVVTDAGDYVLTVTAPNGCTDEATAVVLEDINQPDVTATGGTFNCSFPDVLLQGSSNTTGVTFEWTGPNGFITNVLDTAVTVVGDYILTATATNGCTSTATAAVVSDLDPPADVNGTGGILSCSSSSLALSGSTSTPNVQYFWTGPGGFTSVEQNPTVSAPGTYILTVTSENGCQDSDAAVVAQDANAPQVSTIGATLSCNEMMVQIFASSTNQGVSYTWTGPNGFTSNQQNPMVNTGGTYTVTVKAPNGCVTEETATVDEDLGEPQNVSASGGTLTCLTGVLTISGNSSSPNVTFSWSGPNGFTSDQANTDVSLAGTYTLTVTGENGCTSTTNAVVQNDSNTPTSLASSGEVTCSSPTVSLNGQSNTGTIFEWTGPAGFTSNQQNPSVAVAGTYTLIVTAANGCTSSTEAEVTVNTTPPVVTASGGLITCQQPDLALQGGSTTTGVTYAWVGPGGFTSTQQNPTVNVGGAYILTVTASNGCTATATATVDLDADVPTASASGGTITCDVTDLQLSGNADQPVVSWAWVGPNGFTSNQQNPTSVSVPGNYILTITTGNGCSATANALVNEDTVLPNVVIAPPAPLTCDMVTVVLDANGSDSGVGFNLLWSSLDGNILSGQNTLSPEVSQSGIYTLEITNIINGCSDVANVQVQTNGDTPTAVALVIDDDFCFGENAGSMVVEAVIGGTSPFLYSLNNSPFGTENVFSNLAPGTYQIAIEDSNGCGFNESFTIDQPVDIQLDLASVGLGAGAVPLGESVELIVNTNMLTTDIASVIWTPAGIDANCVFPCLVLNLVPDESTLYSVTLVDSSGCSNSDEILIPVDKSRPVFVPNAFSPNNDGFNDQLVIFGGKSVSSIKSFLIFSRWGEVVFEGYNLPHSDFSYGWDGTHRGDILDVGVYTWFAEVEFVDGETIMLEGDVTLIR